MRTLILILALVSYCICSQESDRLKFYEFQAKYGRLYSNQREAEYRFTVFQANLRVAEQMDKEAEGVARFGVTKFSDITPAEFKDQYLALDVSKFALEKPSFDIELNNTKNTPPMWDWRSSYVFPGVTPVKNQGNCGSCWAFSAAGSLESMNAVRGQHVLRDQSPQQFVDCVADCDGCDGGLPHLAFDWAIRAGGSASNISYPYFARNQQCQKKPASLVPKDYKLLGNGDWQNSTMDESKMADIMFQYNALSFALDAQGLQFYISGVYTMNKYCAMIINHAVLGVGYGLTPLANWIVKNSWGPDWGEAGYFRIMKGAHNLYQRCPTCGMCGINVYAATPCLDKPCKPRL